MIRSPAADMAPDAFWRSLGFFSIYRLLIGLMFLFAVWVYGDTLNLATQNLTLFVRADSAYLTTGVVFLALLWRRRPGFDLQLSVQVAADVGFLTVLMYASGGQKSGIALLLLVVLAGAGLVGQGRLTLFYAALASVAMLLEQSWRALTLDADAADFFRTGLTCVAFFGTAIMARLLARRVVANEELARLRGEELKHQLQVSERIIRDMGDGVLVVDAQGLVRQSNPGADRVLGKSAPGSPLAAVSKALGDCFSDWSGRRTEATAILRGIGSRPLRVRYLPPSEKGGSSLIYLEDLDRIQAQAQQLKLAALGRLTANIAHEIRNPLAAISHAAELLAEDDKDPVRTRLATIVGDNTRRLNRLVTDVLELGRRDRAEPVLIRWPEFISGVLEELALQDRSAALRIVREGEDGDIWFDRAHLHRVLWNLLSNALRYASMETGAIRVSFKRWDAGRAAVEVVDDGVGIEPALQGQIFEPFFTTRSSGTGLGLYIARELCEANGAQLELVPDSPGAHFRMTVRSQS